MSKLWGGRFTKDTNKQVDTYTSSIHVDQVLWKEDIKGSLAHVQMLMEEEIISPEDGQKIKNGLNAVYEKISKGEIEFLIEDEDIHMNIEKALYEEIGHVAGKLHTARSRNDQVATDTHLYVKEKTLEIMQLLKDCQGVLFHQASTHVDTILPGYTHLQRAQPISLAHHLMAYFWMLQRDYERFEDSLKRLAFCPLGSGALAGTTFPINRLRTAELLGFQSVYPNSLDAVSNRDYMLEFINNSSIVMIHLSRLSEELILWCSSEFQFVELDDAFCTGSSMMPQKKNPDVPELIRGKTGRILGNYVGLSTVLKGLPLAYNKDLQEDKEGVFDTANTVINTLNILAPLLETIKINKKKMYEAVSNDYSNATDLADYFVGLGITFREAHEIVGRIVMYAIKQEKYLLQLTLLEYKSFFPLVDEMVYQILLPENVLEARSSEGGTSIKQIYQQLKKAEHFL